jgi:hypothetical protein
MTNLIYVKFVLHTTRYFYENLNYMRTNLRTGILFLLIPLFIISTQIQGQPKQTDTGLYREIVMPDNAAAAHTNDPMAQFGKMYPHVLRKLQADFKAISNLEYSVTGNRVYLSFKDNDRPVSSVYSKKGKIRYSILHLGTGLSGPVYERIKKEYPGYTVFYARYIKTKKENLYHIILENQFEYRIIKLTHAVSEELSSMEK